MLTPLFRILIKKQLLFSGRHVLLPHEKGARGNSDFFLAPFALVSLRTYRSAAVSARKQRWRQVKQVGVYFPSSSSGQLSFPIGKIIVALCCGIGLVLNSDSNLCCLSLAA